MRQDQNWHAGPIGRVLGYAAYGVICDGSAQIAAPIRIKFTAWLPGILVAMPSPEWDNY
jgi:hypothetical protein